MTDNTCLSPQCLTDRQVKEAVLTTKMNSLIGLSVLAVGLLSYSVLWQAPAMRAESAKEINRLDTSDRDIKADIERLSLRVSAIEIKEP